MEIYIVISDNKHSNSGFVYEKAFKYREIAVEYAQEMNNCESGRVFSVIEDKLE